MRKVRVSAVCGSIAITAIVMSLQAAAPPENARRAIQTMLRAEATHQGAQTARRVVESVGCEILPPPSGVVAAPSPASYNISGKDTAPPTPHRINEVSMIVSPTGTRQARNLVDMGFCAYMRYPTKTDPDSADGPHKIVVARGLFGRPTWIYSTPDIQSFPAPFNTGDPVLASNASDDGFHPHRVYLVGTTFVRAPTENDNHENQITIWHMDPSNDAAQWVVNQAFDHNPDNTTAKKADVFDDKATLAVSQFPGNQNHPSTLGDVYVAYVQLRQAPGELLQETIRFWRDHCTPTPGAPCTPNGADNWTATTVYQPVAQDHLQAPRLDVDPIKGVIFLSWLNWTRMTLNVMASADGGVHWSAPQTSPYVDQLLTTGDPSSNSVIKNGSSAEFVDCTRLR